MTTGTLNEKAGVYLNASGNGTAFVGPIGQREVWLPDTVHVQASSDNNEATCVIYVGDAPEQRCYRDSTISGSLGDSTSKIGGPLKAPHRVWAVWTGGDPGAYASMVVTGTKNL